MPKLLTEAQIDHATREGYVCPVRIMTRERAHYFLEQLEAYERQTGERARDLKVKGHLLFKWMMELAHAHVVGCDRGSDRSRHHADHIGGVAQERARSGICHLASGFGLLRL